MTEILVWSDFEVWSKDELSAVPLSAVLGGGVTRSAMGLAA